MSTVTRSKYDLDHSVFRGGRYLEAFSALCDIDHYELAILQYLGHKMPFHKGFVGEAAYPSIATISLATKIPQSTLRKKIKQLVTKGYLIKKPRFLLNGFGHIEQSSNDYFLTDLAFDHYSDVLETKDHQKKIRQRTVGESIPFSPDSPPVSDDRVGEARTEKPALSVVESNSSNKSEKITRKSKLFRAVLNVKEPGSCDEIIAHWQKKIGKSVSPFEQKRFEAEYSRYPDDVPVYLERIDTISKDPYLLARAHSINWLFKGYFAALRNKNDIRAIAGKALQTASSKKDLDFVKQQLPCITEQKSLGTLKATENLIKKLCGKDFQKAQKRLGLNPDKNLLPKNLAELHCEIERQLLRDDISEKLKSRFSQIMTLSNISSFDTALGLYKKRLEECRSSE